MPMYSKTELEIVSRKYGFQRDTFEKVVRLKSILTFFQEHQLLSQHLVLKGGTAINLTVFSLPRLSVDIDLDYIPNDSREEMLMTRSKISKIINDYMISEGYQPTNNSRFSHSLDAFYFRYRNAGGNWDILKIELNYSLRAHVLKPVSRIITTDALGEKIHLTILHPLEIFATKVNALLSRTSARDLYDVFNLMNWNLTSDQHDFELLRKMIIFYASISLNKMNSIFELSAIEQLSFVKIRRDLFPVLTRQETSKHFDLDFYKQSVKDFLEKLMKLTDKESEYMERFQNGEYLPELLFEDEDIVRRIEKHPMAIWKTIT